MKDISKCEKEKILIMDSKCKHVNNLMQEGAQVNVTHI